ncbi:Receptor-like serine/threonine-protein kinase NCRK [Platanthera zijinensis]|uniref:non-specific serine/threonine protein kinase n=1 Tax=Platanthera zijinensis TaxID=2320716 RepID=A0AAP0BLP2_9ASPA
MRNNRRCKVVRRMRWPYGTQSRDNAGVVTSGGGYRGRKAADILHRISVIFRGENQIIPGSTVQFSFYELEQATDRFSNDNLIGQGISSNVFRGKLMDGRIVAIKKLKVLNKAEADTVFLTEIELISRLNHCHVVPLLGYCSEYQSRNCERLLVFEYMSNGNLRECLDAKHGKEPLNWATRVRVAIGAARGLEYLHEASAPRILHRDIKSTNILLDENYRPKITDLGMAKYLMSDDHPSCPSSPARMLGTFGYFAPEYAIVGKASLKSDVFSYGVVILELITGRQPIQKSAKGDESLVIWSTARLNDSKLIVAEMPDPLLKGNFPEEEMQIMAHLARECLQWDPDSRPTMTEIVQILTAIAPEKYQRRNFHENFQRKSRYSRFRLLTSAAFSVAAGALPGWFAGGRRTRRWAPGRPAAAAEKAAEVSRRKRGGGGYRDFCPFECQAGEARLVTREARLVTGEARLITGEARLVTGEARLITGEARLVTGEARLVTGEARSNASRTGGTRLKMLGLSWRSIGSNTSPAKPQQCSTLAAGVEIQGASRRAHDQVSVQEIKRENFEQVHNHLSSSSTSDHSFVEKERKDQEVVLSAEYMQQLLLLASSIQSNGCSEEDVDLTEPRLHECLVVQRTRWKSAMDRWKTSNRRSLVEIEVNWSFYNGNGGIFLQGKVGMGFSGFTGGRNGEHNASWNLSDDQIRVARGGNHR